jgi:enoyl-[acyl-carrier-protein] reductase (NADH)
MHSVAFAPKDAFATDSLLDISRDTWHATQDASVYSLLALTR